MFTVIIYGTYTGDLTAHLTISFTDLPIKTLSDLVAQSAVKPLVPEGTNLDTLLSSSTGGVYRQVADKMLMFQKMHETGIMQKLFNTYWSSDAVCSSGSSTEADSINLEGSGGCFIVALAFYGLGLLTLLVELLWTKALKRHPLDCVVY
uniref:PBPe domain-containing protein n=1 Tax=Macrostomum lignano TaxID=282301 RepID=A0A1I8HE84_9PLAT